MKGELGGEISFLLSYTAFLVFVAYVSGLAGIAILGNIPQPPSSVTAPTILNVLAPFGYFVALLSVSSEYQIIFTLLLTPAIVVTIYIIIKALPFT